MRFDDTDFVTGAFVFGTENLGIAAEDLAVGGFLENDVTLPADNGKLICGTITTWPTDGTLTAYEDGSFTYVPGADGEYTAEYTLRSDGATIDTGIIITFYVGVIGATLTGVEGTGSVGGVTVSIEGTVEVNIAGVQAEGLVGTMVLPVDQIISIDGVSGAGSVGAISITGNLIWQDISVSITQWTDID